MLGNFSLLLKELQRVKGGPGTNGGLIAPPMSGDPQKAYLDPNSEDTMVYDCMKLEILT